LDRVQKDIRAARRRRFSFRRAAAPVARLAAAGAFAFTVSPAFADGAGCPGATSTYDANGAKIAILDNNPDRKLDVLAIGSSSTEGIGASSPANAYPARLEAELSGSDGIAADVKNAGVGGELAAKTLQRLENALKSRWAELVIWQVGTNDAISGVDEALFRATVESGVAAARAAGVPLLLIDPQFMPKYSNETRYERFVKIVDEVGARDHVPVLSRFAMMKERAAKGALALLSRDGLHMNDLGYKCVAHAIAEAIESLEGAKGAKL
jgi:lysophospholipase L1-like esterase